MYDTVLLVPASPPGAEHALAVTSHSLTVAAQSTVLPTLSVPETVNRAPPPSACVRVNVPPVNCMSVRPHAITPDWPPLTVNVPNTPVGPHGDTGGVSVGPES